MISFEKFNRHLNEIIEQYRMINDFQADCEYMFGGSNERLEEPISLLCEFLREMSEDYYDWISYFVYTFEADFDKAYYYENGIKYPLDSAYKLYCLIEKDNKEVQDED